MNRIAQAYGYAVCLVAVIVLVANIGAFTTSLLALSDPLHAGMRYGRPENASLSSFEAYKVSQEQMFESRSREAPGGDTKPVPPDSALRRRYTTLRADREDDVRGAARRELLQSTVLLVLAVLLFVTHWRWLRHRDAREAAGSAA